MELTMKYRELILILNQIKKMDNPWYFTTYGFLCNNRESTSEYIFICQDDLYIASTTPEEILHMLQDKYKINIYHESDFPHNPGGTNICQLKDYYEKLYANVNMTFTDELPRDLHIAFEIIKLFIRKGNLNLIHIKNTFQHFNDLSRKRKLDKLYNEV